MKGLVLLVLNKCVHWDRKKNTKYTFESTWYISVILPDHSHPARQGLPPQVKIWKRTLAALLGNYPANMCWFLNLYLLESKACLPHQSPHWILLWSETFKISSEYCQAGKKFTKFQSRSQTGFFVPLGPWMEMHFSKVPRSYPDSKWLYDLPKFVPLSEFPFQMLKPESQGLSLTPLPVSPSTFCQARSTIDFTC